MDIGSIAEDEVPQRNFLEEQAWRLADWGGSWRLGGSWRTGAKAGDTKTVAGGTGSEPEAVVNPAEEAEAKRIEAQAEKEAADKAVAAAEETAAKAAAPEKAAEVESMAPGKYKIEFTGTFTFFPYTISQGKSFPLEINRDGTARLVNKSEDGDDFSIEFGDGKLKLTNFLVGRELAYGSPRLQAEGYHVFLNSGWGCLITEQCVVKSVD